MSPARRPLRPFDQLTDAGRVLRYRRVALEALASYDLEVARLVPVREGECMIFRVETPARERFALRIHDPGYQSGATVRSELQWLRALRDETDLAVPEPLPNRAGDVVTVAGADGIEGLRICDVLRWQEGRFSYARTTARAYYSIGRFLATMHRHAEAFAPPRWFSRQRWDGEHVFGRPIEEAIGAVRPHLSRDDLGVVHRVVEWDREARADIGEATTTFGLIHADLTQGNLLFHRGEVRAIDFDDCGFGHYLYDIAVTLSRGRYRADYPTVRSSLLDGYRSLRPLPAGVERHLDPLIAARRFSLMAWQVLRWEEPDGIERYVSGIRTIIEASGSSVDG